MITRICDVCGKPIDESTDIYYSFKKHMWFGYSSDSHYGSKNIDVCDRCWDVIQEYILEKKLKEKTK